jgi:DNA-binding Xre family transcriptional regulator
MKVRINEILMSKGKSKTWLCRITGIRQGYMSRLASGKVESPTVYTAYLISKALEVPIEQIWTLDENNGQARYLPPEG